MRLQLKNKVSTDNYDFSSKNKILVDNCNFSSKMKSQLPIEALIKMMKKIYFL